MHNTTNERNNNNFGDERERREREKERDREKEEREREKKKERLAIESWTSVKFMAFGEKQQTVHGIRKNISQLKKPFYVKKQYCLLS
jgi:hypothetical protein